MGSPHIRGFSRYKKVYHSIYKRVFSLHTTLHYTTLHYTRGYSLSLSLSPSPSPSPYISKWGSLPDSFLLCQHIFVSEGEICGHRCIANGHSLQ